MIRFNRAELTVDSGEEYVQAYVLSEFDDGLYLFHNTEFRAYDLGGNPMLRILVPAQGRFTKEGIDSGEQELNPAVYESEAANTIGMYSILPGVELHLISEWTADGKPEGYVRELGPGLLREYRRHN